MSPVQYDVLKGANNQAAKFGTTVQKSDQDIHVGGIEFGTIVLAAHGSSTEIDGTLLGSHLGQKTPEQIVALLTANADEKKRLSPTFHGTLILSGCFTAAGHEVVPVNYDYAAFALKVHNLLLRQGYQNFKVQGMAGPSLTLASGDKLVQPAAVHAQQEKLEKEVKRKNEKTERTVQGLEAYVTRLSDEIADIVKLHTRLSDQLKGLVTDVKDLDVELKAIDQQLKDLGESSATDPFYLGLQAHRRELQTRWNEKEALRTQWVQKLKTLKADHEAAQDLINKKRGKMDDRIIELTKQVLELEKQFTAEGIITFGGRVL